MGDGQCQSVSAERARALLTDYVGSWNTPDREQRMRLLERCWSASATYTDPNVALVGPHELDAHVAGLHNRRPGALIEIVGGINLHHHWASFSWRVVLADGAVAVEGIDAVEFRDDRIRRVVGFFGGAPPWPET